MLSSQSNGNSKFDHLKQSTHPQERHVNLGSFNTIDEFSSHQITNNYPASQNENIENDACAIFRKRNKRNSWSSFASNNLNKESNHGYKHPRRSVLTILNNRPKQENMKRHSLPTFFSLGA